MFNGEGQPLPALQMVEFHRVSFADQPQTQRTQRESKFNPNILASLPTAAIHPLVHYTALGCEYIFYPELLNVNQGALPLTKENVLEGGKRQKIIFGIQIYPP